MVWFKERARLARGGLHLHQASGVLPSRLQAAGEEGCLQTREVAFRSGESPALSWSCLTPPAEEGFRRQLSLMTGH